MTFRQSWLVFCLVLPGCARPATETLEGLYGEAPPADVKILHYYGEGIGLDPTFAWVLSPIDDAYLKRLIQNKSLKAPPAGDRPPPARYAFPHWWDYDQIEALPEVYFNDGEGLRRIWVDRKRGRLYIEFIGT